jgi:plasmid maintenance system antidote protein VapI
MAVNELTSKELIAYMQELVVREGSQVALADQLNIDRSYLCLILNGKRQISDSVANALGFIKVTRYKIKVGDNDS